MDDPPNAVWSEDEWIPISALMHATYCPRRCSLIHVEQSFEENIYTLRGNRVHRQAHEPGQHTTAGANVVRGLPIWSAQLGITGRADIVEFRDDGSIVPVEYKAGKHRGWRPEAVQLCAQAMCLEAMLGARISFGDIFYHASRERRTILFDDELRAGVVTTIGEVRQLLRTQRLPPAPDDQRCPNCSLIDLCLPQVAGQPHRVGGFHGALFQIDDGADSGEWD